MGRPPSGNPPVVQRSRTAERLPATHAAHLSYLETAGFYDGSYKVVDDTLMFGHGKGGLTREAFMRFAGGDAGLKRGIAPARRDLVNFARTHDSLRPTADPSDPNSIVSRETTQDYLDYVHRLSPSNRPAIAEVVNFIFRHSYESPDIPPEARRLGQSTCARFAEYSGRIACQFNNECEMVLHRGVPETEAECSYVPPVA